MSVHTGQADHHVRRFFHELLACIAIAALRLRGRWRGRGQLVVAGDYGRLGNALVRSSHLVALARQLDFDVLDFSFQRYAHLFPATERNLLETYPACSGHFRIPRPIRRLLGRLGDKILHAISAYHARGRQGDSCRNKYSLLELPFYEYNIADGITPAELRTQRHYDLASPRLASELANHGLLFMQGWRFRHSGIATMEDKLSEQWKPHPKLVAGIVAELEELRKSADHIVGVHIRQTDYRNWLGGRYFLQPQDYLARMHETISLWPGRTAFFICSDERLDSNLFRDFTVSCHRRTDIEDLHGLSLCDAIMGPPSTFSGWAAFVGNRPLCWLRRTNVAPDPAFRTRYEQQGYELRYDDFHQVSNWCGVEIALADNSWLIL